MLSLVSLFESCVKLYGDYGLNALVPFSYVENS